MEVGWAAGSLDVYHRMYEERVDIGNKGWVVLRRGKGDESCVDNQKKSTTKFQVSSVFTHQNQSFIAADTLSYSLPEA